MDSIASSLLIEIYSSIDVFLLILIRILGFVIVIPIFSGQNVPMPVKLGFSVAVTYILATTQTISVSYTFTIPAYTFMMIKEFLVGFLLAFVVYIVFSIIHFAGQMMDYQIGFSMVSVYDPVSQVQVPITGNLFYFVVLYFFVVTGGLHNVVHALFYSYILLPIDSAVLLDNSELVSYFLSLLLAYFVLGVQIAMPIMGSILILDIALGLLVKAVPQMNIFVVGVPLKLFLGVIILIPVSAIYYDIYDILYAESMRAMSDVIRSIRP